MRVLSGRTIVLLILIQIFAVSASADALQMGSVSDLLRQLEYLNSPMNPNCPENQPLKKCPQFWKKKMGQMTSAAWGGLIDSPLDNCTGVRLVSDELQSPRQVDQYFDQEPFTQVDPEHQFNKYQCSETAFVETNSADDTQELLRLTAFKHRHDLSKLIQASQSLANEMVMMNELMGKSQNSDIPCEESASNKVREFCNAARSTVCPKSGRRGLVLRGLLKEYPRYRALAKKLMDIAPLYQTDKEKYSKQFKATRLEMEKIKREFPFIGSNTFFRAMANKEINSANLSNAMRRELTNRRNDAKEKFQELQKASKCLTEERASGCGNIDRIMASIPDIAHMPLEEESEETRMAEVGLSTLQCMDSTRQSIRSVNTDLVLSGLTVASLGIGSIAVRGTGILYKAASAVRPGMSMAQRAQHLRSTIQSAKALASTNAGKALIATYGIDAAFFGDSASLAYEACQSQIEASAELAPTPSINFQCTTPKQMAFYKKRMDASSCLTEVGMASLDLLPFVGPAVLSVVRANRNRRLAETASLNERRVLAERSLGRSLTSREVAEVERAHLIGKGEPGRNGKPAELGNYTQQQIIAKIRILKRAGFTSDEIRKLLDDGVAGLRGSDVPRFVPGGIERLIQQHQRISDATEDYLRRNPKALNGINRNSAFADKRLAEHLGISEVELQFMRNNNTLKPNFSGGEADIFVSSNRKTALKVWRPDRMDVFEESTREMVALQHMINKDPKISQYLRVSEITEMGPGYIVKEYFPNAIPFKDVPVSREVDNAIRNLKKSLRSHPDPNARRILNMISDSRISENLMWDTNLRRIVLIDAPGF